MFGKFLNKSLQTQVAKSVTSNEKIPDTENDLAKQATQDSYQKESDSVSDEVSVEADPGVKKAEGTTLVWGKKAVIFTYAWIWVCFFMLAFQSAIGNNVISYAYSDFNSAPQVATANILATIIGGVIKLPIAKLLNIWGRAEGFLVFVGVYLIGVIVIASSKNPNSYAAGYVLYWIGYDAIYLILDVFIADTSGLRNRAFTFAFASTPFICTAFTGPLAAASFLKTSGWRWAYGAFAIINFAVFVPLAAVFKYYQNKAIKLGVIKPEPSGRTKLQSFIHYFHEFDIVGALLLMASFILFLLPFSLETYGRAQYHSATFIAMVVIGVLLFPVFVIWEKYFARVRFIRWSLLKQRTVWGACLLSAILYFSFYCWDLYFYNFVMLVYNLSVSDGGYMLQIYNVGSCFWGVVFGVYVRYTKHFKYACLCFGLPLMLLGSGLLIHFRGEDSNIGFIVMCQIFIAFAGGTLVIGEQMALMCASGAIDGIPLMLSLAGLFSSLGGSIGSAVITAISNNFFVSSLMHKMPSLTEVEANTIYLSGVTGQLAYLKGTDTRAAIDYAYGQVQKKGSIASTCILVLGIPAIFVWKNFNVDKKQNKGQVL